MVLVAVRQDHRAHGPLAVGEVAEIREDQVDAEVLVPRERKARIDDDRLAVSLVDSHVLADLAEAAEGDDPSGSGHCRSLAPGLG